MSVFCFQDYVFSLFVNAKGGEFYVMCYVKCSVTCSVTCYVICVSGYFVLCYVICVSGYLCYVICVSVCSLCSCYIYSEKSACIATL